MTRLAVGRLLGPWKIRCEKKRGEREEEDINMFICVYPGKVRSLKGREGRIRSN